MKSIILLPHIKVHNANALSSPYTIGFPAMTAWLGAVHALQRKLNQMDYEDLSFSSIAVVSHECNLQVYKGDNDYVYSIVSKGNPLDKDGNRPAFIEEARCHLEVSLLIECEGLPFDKETLLEQLSAIMHSGWKIAGGDIVAFGKLDNFVIEHEADHKKLMRKLMPGYVLVERRQLMINAMQSGQDAVDALLDFIKVKHRSELNEQGEVVWRSAREEKGWIVPIATGFHGITELGKAQNQRDPDTPHRFAESVVTLGEFIMPYRIKNLDDMLWHYYVDLSNNLYLCQQNNQASN